MLDRESQNDDTTIQWSTDGNSFIIIDQAKFEEVGIIPDDVWSVSIVNLVYAVQLTNPSWPLLLLYFNRKPFQHILVTQ